MGSDPHNVVEREEPNMLNNLGLMQILTSETIDVHDAVKQGQAVAGPVRV